MPIYQPHIEPLTHFELLANQVVEGFITGLHKSPFHGFSVEFAEHRLYNQGESTRHIDWKLYGRSDKLFVKRFEEETNLRCQLVIDNSSSMYYPASDNKNIKTLNKIGFSAYAAAAMMLILKNQGDAYGLTLFKNEIQLQSQAKSNIAHQKFILAELAKLVDGKSEGETANPIKALHIIAESIHKRSLVVLFTDMLDQTEKQEELFSALQHLKHNKHEVVLFHVLDKKTELDFQFDTVPYKFIDLETKEEIKLNPQSIKANYMDALHKQQKELKEKCLSYKIDYVEADIALGFQQILSAYLLKRQKI